jgi:glycosyltransferase involved in cell wall biosynthesis
MRTLPASRGTAHSQGSPPRRVRSPPLMRIFVWHGYLLGGTGSNIYARQLSREWSREGHDVTVFSQEPWPDRFDLGGAETVRPDVGGLLPVFVLDRYEGYEVKLVQDCSRDLLDAWVEANAAAIRDRGPADLLFGNHVLLGGPVGAASGSSYVVKAHGSELEYSMRGNEELSAWGGEALAGAEATIVGSAHVRGVVRDVCGTVDRVHEVPPGVDVELWRPARREEALEQLVAEARRDPPNAGNANERLPDEGNAERLAAFLAGERPTVVYFGKLIENKGVQVLLEALRGLDARTVIVGFGDYRAELEQQAAGLDALFTGPLEHRHLVHLLALADTAVAPSIFPEAFGMVAAEAAAAGCPPIVANHSGLAEIARGLEEDYPPGRGGLASFPNGDVAALRERLEGTLALRGDERAALREAARRAAVERWSWTSVARRIFEVVRAS